MVADKQAHDGDSRLRPIDNLTHGQSKSESELEFPAESHSQVPESLVSIVFTAYILKKCVKILA